MASYISPNTHTHFVGSDSLVEESHLTKLHNLDAFIKETHYLHSALPFLVGSWSKPIQHYWWVLILCTQRYQDFIHRNPKIIKLNTHTHTPKSKQSYTYKTKTKYPNLKSHPKRKITEQSPMPTSWYCLIRVFFISIRNYQKQ